MTNRWNQFVLNYSSTRQFDLLRALGVRAPDGKDLARILALMMATVALAGAAPGDGAARGGASRNPTGKHEEPRRGGRGRP